MFPLSAAVLVVMGAFSAASPTPAAEHPESVAEHMVGAHSPDFDHEAFLGRAEAERFDQLPPAEAKRRLGMLVDKIDANRDGYVTERELEEWVRHVANSLTFVFTSYGSVTGPAYDWSTGTITAAAGGLGPLTAAVNVPVARYIMDDVMRQWAHYDLNNDDHVTWEEFRDSTFGEHLDDSEIYDEHRGLTYKDMMSRDVRRFAAADLDGDQRLTRDELADFLHPEDAPHMQEIVLDETMDDMDQNNDGYITVIEYIDDIWPQYERERTEEEPEWLVNEREHFISQRDKDGDGRLNKQELREWILPENYDHAKAEAAHLIYESDVDSDQKLTKEEILQHQDVFVGSQATDFGDYLVRHEEF